MYGLIFLCVKDLVLKQFGEKKWKKICTGAGVRSDSFVQNQPYDDKILYDLLRVASELLSLSVSVLLETAGSWFISYVKSTEYCKLLSVAGSSFVAIITHLNSMHTHMRNAHFSHLNMPDFHAIVENDQCIRLQYSPGLLLFFVVFFCFFEYHNYDDDDYYYYYFEVGVVFFFFCL